MRALIYTRISNKEVTAPLSFLLHKQLKACEKRAEEFEITDIVCYSDTGSTPDKDRSAFDKMLADYQEDDIIITVSPDRLFRDRKQYLAFREKYRVAFTDISEEKEKALESCLL
jgi:DNA invertase Pin-like site-specific DNA recombinase